MIDGAVTDCEHIEFSTWTSFNTEWDYINVIVSFLEGSEKSIFLSKRNHNSILFILNEVLL